jgi:hypothetical protein
MYEHDGLTPVEFRENGEIRRITEPLGSGVVAVAREQANAVSLEHVECIFDFAQAAIRIRQWYDGK